MYILQLLIIKAFTVTKTLSKIDMLSLDDCIISEKTLIHLILLFEQTRIKLILYFQQQSNQHRSPPDLSSYTTKHLINFIVNYPMPMTERYHCSAYYLSVEYYKQNGSYPKNSRFLFGTASQFCK